MNPVLRVACVVKTNMYLLHTDHAIPPTQFYGGGWGLVVFPVFKIAWGAVDPVLGGFDSHTLPP